MWFSVKSTFLSIEHVVYVTCHLILTTSFWSFLDSPTRKMKLRKKAKWLVSDNSITKG